MVSYIYDAVLATAGEDIGISAFLNTCDEQPPKESWLTLYDDEKKVIIKVEGLYIPETTVWSFKVPADATAGLSGRYWYVISGANNVSFNFKTPIYLK